MFGFKMGEQTSFKTLPYAQTGGRKNGAKTGQERDYYGECKGNVYNLSTSSSSSSSSCTLSLRRIRCRAFLMLSIAMPSITAISLRESFNLISASIRNSE